MTGPFRSASAFRESNSYRLLPFRFMRLGSEMLVVNEVGEHAFVAANVFSAFASGRLTPAAPDYATLKSRHFLLDSASTVPVQLLATKYRTKKSFLEGFTSLHMFVVTLRCDHSCHYCQVSRVTEDRARYDMTPETAARAVALMFESPSPTLKVEFQGGESLLNFVRIQQIVGLVEVINQTADRRVQFVVATNLSPLTDEMLEFFRDHDVHLSTSIDGPQFLHDANRPRRGGESHAITERNLDRARLVLGQDRVAALMTTTALSLRHPTEIVDEYVRLGFDSIFLRSISPYGFALRTGVAFGYDADEFLAFYRTGLDYIIALNRKGVRIVEAYAQMLLRRILTPFATGYVDLQSPAGAGIAAVAYNYDGSVYASDEARMLAEMGDHSFRLGNVHTDTYREIFGGPTLRRLTSASILEAIPGCSECAFLPFCGADPVFHWATQRDPVGHRPTSAFCQRQMGVFGYLFGKLRAADEFTLRLFLSWATEVPMTEGDTAS